MEKAAILSKKSLLRPIGQRHPNPEIAQLELEILADINNLGIGPQGLGGRVTAFDVHIETYPTHIGSIPVAVNLQCHSGRHKESKTIKRVEVVAYEDLGTEAIRKLEVEEFPAIVVGDVRGNDLYREGRMKYRRA